MNDIDKIKLVLSKPSRPVYKKRDIDIAKKKATRRKALKKKSIYQTVGFIYYKDVELPVGKNNDFYLSREWGDARNEILKYNGKYCMLCMKAENRIDGFLPKKGRRKKLKEQVLLNVDHIKPLSQYPELALDIKNLQILCSKCNKQKGATIADYRDNKERF